MWLHPFFCTKPDTWRVEASILGEGSQLTGAHLAHKPIQGALQDAQLKGQLPVARATAPQATTACLSTSERSQAVQHGRPHAAMIEQSKLQHRSSCGKRPKHLGSAPPWPSAAAVLRSSWLPRFLMRRTRSLTK